MNAWKSFQDPTWQNEYKKHGKKLAKKRKKRAKAVGELAECMRKHLNQFETALDNILKDYKGRHTMQRHFKCHKGYNFIADCYIPSKKLIVEVDGGYHEAWWQRQRDLFRTGTIILKNHEIRVLRFTNEEIAGLSAEDIMGRINDI